MPSSGRVRPVLRASRSVIRSGPPHFGSNGTSHAPVNLLHAVQLPGSCPVSARAGSRFFVLWNTTNQLCRGANCSGTTVRPFSSRQSGRSRMSPVTASQSSGCLPATRNTTCAVASQRALVAEEVDLRLAVAAMDPVEVRARRRVAELDVRRQAVGAGHGVQRPFAHLGHRSARVFGPMTVTPASASSLTFFSVAGERMASGWCGRTR